MEFDEKTLLELQLEEAVFEYGLLKQENELLLNSSSWKLTAPLRRISKVLSARSKGIKYSRKTGAKNHQYLDSFIPIDYSCKKRIDIICGKSTIHVARALRNQLNETGYISCISIGEPPEYYDIPYIIFAPWQLSKFPKNYIVYQMEQMISPKWDCEEHLALLRNAKAIFDYSSLNVAILRKYPDISSKHYYVPVLPNTRLLKETEYIDKKEYDILFYGWYTGRRIPIIEELKKEFNIVIIENLYGDQLYKELIKAKIVLNIHNFANAIQEVSRLYEILSLGNSMVISEQSCDFIEDARLNDIVDFVSVGDLDAIRERLAFWLDDDKRKIKILDNNKRLLSFNDKADLSSIIENIQLFN